MPCNEIHKNIGKDKDNNSKQLDGMTKCWLSGRGTRVVHVYCYGGDQHSPVTGCAAEDNTCLRQLYSSRNHDPSTLFLPRLVLDPIIIGICVRNLTFTLGFGQYIEQRESLNLGVLDS